MKPATPQAARMIAEARKAGLSLWVRDSKNGGIVGYITPDGELIRVANAAILYQRALNEAKDVQDG